MSQLDLARLIRSSDPTINRWENGQPIPGPADILLDWLIDGKVPFQDHPSASKLGLPPEAKEASLNVQMKLRTWHEIEALASGEGYTDVTDWIATLILEALSQEQGTRGGIESSEMALVAEESPPYVTGSKAVADSLAAEWVAKNPPPGGAVTSTADNGAEPPEKEGGSPVP